MNAVFTKIEFMNAGCMQFESPILGFALYNLTGGNLCPECPKNNHCEAQNKLRANAVPQSRTPATPTYTETVREEAARRNISIKQVRRERNEARIEATNPQP